MSRLRSGKRDRLVEKMLDWTDSIDARFYQAKAGIVQRVLFEEKYNNILISENPSGKRKPMQDACLSADTTTSLWTAVHVIHSWMFLSHDDPSEINKQRGRSSIWGCWLQMLLTAKRDLHLQGRGIPAELRELAYVMIVFGANPKYTLHSRTQGSGEWIFL